MPFIKWQAHVSALVTPNVLATASNSTSTSLCRFTSTPATTLAPALGYIPMVGAGSFNQHLAPCFTNSALPPPIFCWSLSQCSAPPAPPSVMLTRGYTEREELDKLFTCYFICIQCISY